MTGCKRPEMSEKKWRPNTIPCRNVTVLFCTLGILSATVTLLLISCVVPKIMVTGFPTTVFTNVVVNVIGTIVHPVLFVLSLPVAVLALNLFTLIIGNVYL